MPIILSSNWWLCGTGCRRLISRQRRASPVRFAWAFWARFRSAKGCARFSKSQTRCLPTAVHRGNCTWPGTLRTKPANDCWRTSEECTPTRPWWPRVQWLGWVKSPHNFLQTVDLLVVPSSEFDPFPTVLLEAGQCGVPVLASRVGGVPEIVADGQTGWLFEAGKVEAAAQILSRLMATPEILKGAGQAARVRVLREFSASKMVAEHRLLYSNLLTDV